MKGFQPNSNFSHLPSPILNGPCQASQVSSFQLPNSSLLSKRIFQYYPESSDNEIAKKLKITQEGLAEAYNSLENPLKLQNLNSSILANSFLSSQDLQDQLLTTLVQQQMQVSKISQYFQLLSQISKIPENFQISNNQNEKILQMTGCRFNQFHKEDIKSQLKVDNYCEETTDSQAETVQVIEKDFDDDEKLSETSAQEKKAPIPRRVIDITRYEGAPALAEFTMQFPDWDLTTIFDYLKSGKSFETYESERKVRTSKKCSSNKHKKTIINPKKRL